MPVDLDTLSSFVARGRRAQAAVDQIIADEEQTMPPKTKRKSAGKSRGQLKSIVERIERLEEEKSDIGADIREIYIEAKANGFDPVALREIIRLRKMDANDRAEREEIVDIYRAEIGLDRHSGGSR